MNKLLLIILMVLPGCATKTMLVMPSKPELGTCAELQQVPSTATLSTIATTITENYGEYHKCKSRVEAWDAWYQKHQLALKRQK